MALSVKNPTDPSYLARNAKDFGSGVTAGSAGTSSKWVTHANLLLYSLTTYTTVLGTSTYTANGTATASGQQVNVIIVQNTSTTGTSLALSTTTIGPLLAGGIGLATAAIGGSNQFALNTTTGTQGYGGIPVQSGSIVYLVSGTDATAVTLGAIDYSIQFEAPLTI
jgi:hypothetical protein